MLTLNGYREEPENPKHWVCDAFYGYSSGRDIDLRCFSLGRHHQGGTNSCVAQAVVKAFEIKRVKAYGIQAHVDLSRRAVYWLARNMMSPKEISQDDGTYISLAFDAMRRFGVPTEQDFPWDSNRLFEQPTWDAMRKAYASKIAAYFRIRVQGQDRIGAVASALQVGHPVVFGTNVDQTWASYRKGGVLRPVAKEDRTGRHATVLVGLKDGKFIGENSWGNEWGDDGFYECDPQVIAFSGSADFWVAQGSWEHPSNQGQPLRLGM